MPVSATQTLSLDLTGPVVAGGGVGIDPVLPDAEPGVSALPVNLGAMLRRQ